MIDTEVNFEDILIQSLKGKKEVKAEDIREMAERFAVVFPVARERLDEHIKNVESRFVFTMSEGTSLVDQKDSHDNDWYLKRDDIEWSYWKDYERQLISEKWSPKVVNTLGDVTGKILGLLGNPVEGETGDRRGLVIGHVQSGKTANYIGLITKAADAGYKFIIVIAGIHNTLRKQTQERIESGFVGRDSTPGRNKRPVGVGLDNPNRRFPVTITSTEKDFSRRANDQFTADLRGFNQPVIVVIKKHVSTLSNLHIWLKEINTRGGESDKIADIPMLMIDDEADNASINTRKEDLDPTRTNSEIRKILHLFNKKSYVGYTATPFANIFINPDSAKEMIGDELFPRDFIYSLDAPTNYFGPHTVFINEATKSGILRTIQDAEDVIPQKHQKNFDVQNLPETLKEAIHIFILGKAIRILRGHENKHCTMMVNVSRFVDVQNSVKDSISFYLNTLADNIRYSHGLVAVEAFKNPYLAELKNVYDKEFVELEEKWDQIQPLLGTAADSIKTFLINSKSDETLDYKRAEEHGESVTAIAVGGLSLSRGLTLEGLMVSYMYRNTKMYDTLMQMGRWFGYREKYDNLCRVFLPLDSQGWYQHITEATDELRQQIKQMRRDHLSPKDFGLYVRDHPDALYVTALNKMRDAEKRSFQINFKGALQETDVISSNDDMRLANISFMHSLHQELTKKYGSPLPSKNLSLCWVDVDTEFVREFLSNFRFHREMQHIKDALLTFCKQMSDKYPVWDVAFMSLSTREADPGMIIPEKERTAGTDSTGKNVKKTSAEPGWYIGNKKRVGSDTDEKVGLSEDQLALAKSMAEKSESSSYMSPHYRNVRDKPLLMIHLIKLVDAKANILARHIPVLGLSFPFKADIKSVECMVNRVWQMQEMSDYPEDEDEDDN